MRYLIFIIFITLFVSCRGSGDYCSRELLLKLNATTDGLKDTLHINTDTVWFELVIDSLTEDLNTGELIDVAAKSPFDNWRVKPYYLDSMGLDGLDDFEYLADKGDVEIKVSGSFRTIFFTFEDLPAKKVVRYGIVPKKAGAYIFELYLEAYVDHRGHPFILENPLNGCYIHDADLDIRLNENTPEVNNWHIVESEATSVIYSSDNQEEAFIKSGHFAFIAVE